MPALPTQYALIRRWVETPAIDDIAMMEPPPLAAIAAAACLMLRNVPTTLRSSVAFQASRSASTIGPRCSDPPAHANRTSSPPAGAIAAATAARTSASTVTSHTAYCVVTPGAATAVISATASARRASVRPAMVTWAPSAASRLAAPSPMPLPPPVTSAVMPARSDTRYSSTMVMACFGQTRAASRHFSRSASGGCSSRT